ncbi:hypothetical protein EMIT0P218_10101 [Pseudomonas sp. IT-P218]
MTEADERLEELLEKQPLDAFALQAQIARRLKQQVLLNIIECPVSHFEEAIVGIIEQRLQALPELLSSLVANLQDDDRQAGEWRVRRLVGSDPAQRHHIPVVVHPAS